MLQDESCSSTKEDSKNADPRVSVIIPTCDRPLLVQRALKSVFGQTYGNLEAIVVDDGERDIAQIIGSLADSRVKYTRTTKPRSGVSTAKNAGLKLASGELIAFLGDDDEWLPGRLMRQIEVLKKSAPDVGVVHSNGYVVRDGHWFLIHVSDPVQSFEKLLEFDYVIDVTTLIKKECFDAVGNFDERIPYAEDWDMYLRIARHYRFIYLPEPLAIAYYAGRKGLSEDLERKTRGHQIVVLKNWQDFHKRPKVLSEYLTIIGSNLCSLEKWADGRSYLLEAFKTYPLKIVPALLFVFSLHSLHGIRKLLGKSVLNRVLSFSYYPKPL